MPVAAASAAPSSGKPQRKAAPIALSFSLSAAEKQAVSELQAQILPNHQLPQQLRSQKERLRDFLALAAGEAEEGAAAGLDALRESYAGCDAFAADCEAVIVGRLGAPAKVLRFRAALAAESAMTGRAPSEAVKRRVVDTLLAETDPGVQYGLALALRNVRFATPERALVQRLVEQLKTAPNELVAAIALALPRVMAGAPPSDELTATLPSLRRHAVPEVRAAVALLQGNLAKNSDTFALELLPMSSDESPCVRASAAVALADSGKTFAVHTLVTLLADQAPPSCELNGFVLADRTPGRLVLERPAERQVRVAALNAIEVLLTGAPDFEPLARDVSGENAEANAKRVRAWYASHRSKVAKAPLVAAAASSH